MAKKKNVNKSQEVRDYAEAHPKAKNKDIIEAMRKRGIKVVAAQVSQALTSGKGKKKVRKKVKKRIAINTARNLRTGSPAVAAARAAKDLIALTGSRQAAIQLIELIG